MSDWKEELITDSIALEKEREILEHERAEDQNIKNIELTMKKGRAKIRELERPYIDKIMELNTRIEEIHNAFILRWDITDKTYECDLGSATLRTTKSLNIVDEKGLIDVLLKLEKLPEAIRTWNLLYLRKLKDVDMIEDKVAYYDEHQNIIVKETKK